MALPSETVAAVLDRLGVETPARDLDGLRTVYAAWCGEVPFDNTLKLIHLAEGRSWPLPGSSAESFFASWLEHGTGGTCWSGNGALHDLLEALGFDVARAIATMLSSPAAVGPNHGSVIVTVEGERWIVDASIPSGTPIRIPSPGQEAGDGALPRFAWPGDRPAGCGAARGRRRVFRAGSTASARSPPSGTRCTSGPSTGAPSTIS